MDTLVRWVESYQFPEAPFGIGPALKVVDREKFLQNIRQQVGRAESHKAEIPWLRAYLRRLKNNLGGEAVGMSS